MRDQPKLSFDWTIKLILTTTDCNIKGWGVSVTAVNNTTNTNPVSHFFSIDNKAAIIYKNWSCVSFDKVEHRQQKHTDN